MKLKKTFFVVALSGLAAALLVGLSLHVPPLDQTGPIQVASEKKLQNSINLDSLSAQLGSGVASAKHKASQPLFFQLAPVANFIVEPAKPADPKMGGARIPATYSMSYLQPSSLPDLSKMRKGMRVGIPLSDGSSYDGVVNLVKSGKDGSIRIGGGLDGSSGGFSLAKTADGFHGLVRLPENKRAFFIRPQDGRIVMKEHNLDEWQCLGMKRMQIAPQALPAAAQSYTKPVIPIFDTKPTATAVIYLDFDGELVTDSIWNNGNEIDARPPIYLGQPLSDSHIETVVNTVAQDFAPFNVSVTTNEQRYLDAAAGSRARCIITITDPITLGESAGVAYLNSWNLAGTTFDADVPCWCYGMYTPLDMALVISHEVGHTFGLRHDGRGASEYYAGHGGAGGVTSWGPIMGAPYGRELTQWSIGDYDAATNTEDDVAIIASPLNRVGAVVDDIGNTNATADQVVAGTINGAFDTSSFIGNSADQDWFRFVHGAGAGGANGGYNFGVAPVGASTNLDLGLEIRDSTGLVVNASNPNNSRNANVTGTLPPGTYYLVVRGAGEPFAGAITAGFTNYGAMGAYRISGFFTPVPSVPRIDVNPQSIAAVDGSTITLSVTAVGSGGLTYLWFKDGVPMSAETRNTLRLTNMSKDKEGSYVVRVTNATNTNLSALSTAAVVTVNFRPKTIALAPTGTIKLTSGQSLSVTATVDASISPLFRATPNLTYTWQKIRPLTANVRTFTSPNLTDTLAINPVGFNDAGTYRVLVTNQTGVVVTSTSFVVNVDSPPVVLTQPLPLSVIEQGRSGRLSVLAGGLAKLNYQWYKVDRTVTPNVESLVGTNSPTLNIVGQPLNAGTYFVRVSNSLTATLAGGTAAQSADAIVEVDTRPTIVTQPPTRSVLAGDAGVTLSVVAGGTATGRTFRWFKDGRPYLGAGFNTDTLTFAPTITWQDRGAYSVEVRNRVGFVRSVVANLRVSSKPIILTPPPLTVVGATGGSVRFGLVAGGDTPLKYQWFKDGLPAPTPVTAVVTSPILNLSKLSIATHAGSYFCRVSNGHPAGTTDTALVTLAVEDPPKVTAITTNFSANSHRAAVGRDVTITPSFTGTAPFSFEWQKAGRRFTGGTVNPVTGALTLTSAQTGDSGAYSVVISNRTVDVNNRAITSKSASLNVSILIPPTVTRPPRDQAVTEGTPVTLSVDAAGSPTLKYQWYKVEKDLSNNDIEVLVANQTRNVLQFNSPLATNSGRYRCEVSNSVGAVKSPIATLSIGPTPPPTITRFQPTKATKNELILLTGSNLQYLVSAKVGDKAAAVTLISSTQAYVKVPVGLTNNSQNTIEVTSSGTGGKTDSLPSKLVYSDKVANDALIDAVILTGTNFAFQGDSTGFSNGDPVDAEHAFLASAWHWWTSPATRRYTLRTRTTFDIAIARYRGIPGGTLTRIGNFVDSARITNDETMTFTANGGESNVFFVGGYNSNGSWRSEGQYGLILESGSPIPTFESASTPRGSQEWVGYEGNDGSIKPIDDLQEVDGVIKIGGHGKSIELPLLIWNNSLTAPETSKTTVASVKMQLELPEEGSNDRFGWTAVDAEKAPMAALWVDARNGLLNYTSGNGVTTALNQRMISGSPVSIEFLHDAVANQLKVFYEGVVIHTDTTIRSGSSFSTISATYQPAQGIATHGTMIFSDLDVRYE